MGSHEAECGNEVGGRDSGEVDSPDPVTTHALVSVHLPVRAGDIGGSSEHPLTFLCRGNIVGGKDCCGNTGSMRGGRDSSGDR